MELAEPDDSAVREAAQIMPAEFAKLIALSPSSSTELPRDRKFKPFSSAT